MKILHISPDEFGGGAAKAAHRLHEALRALNMNSHMLVLKSLTSDPTIHIATMTPMNKVKRKVKKILGKIKKRMYPQFQSDNPSLQSEGIESRELVKLINNSDANIINLHWINGMLSIEDIGNITKPIVWTFHDMWPFCGAEHYTPDTPTARFRHGYLKNNRTSSETGPDINRFAWERKRKAWSTPIGIATPSQWMKDCASSSALMGNWPIEKIRNPIDTEYWKPLDKTKSRLSKNLPNNKKLVAFGAMGGGQNYYKGFDLLLKSLQLLHNKIDDLELIVFGESAPKIPPKLGFPIHYTGHLDQKNLRLIYNAADVLLIPSRMDNLPNTGSKPAHVEYQSLLLMPADSRISLPIKKMGGSPKRLILKI